MKVSERLKVVDVIGTKVYKDGEQIIAQVQLLVSWFSSSLPRENNCSSIYSLKPCTVYVVLCQKKQNESGI